ncbi:hypothetical protein CONPUDRAFT_117672 [Coniophora puteana RWD-64-598 SS2]|uniref:Carrier domain-containing protein n=1 Tax=Coniophora puteana (strain RWD-64-598) TaxID=741705 RepID=A0A5M3N155_CONPW|nr:uncharacterized protein CONPUDRAFT_117672 [Coniophora puteana RWD-64-598 SS2]EIW85132.1 hypothetical protein CONPUDRAFT_117672 [Coniophora puteana RWD-64-598 SS2]
MSVVTDASASEAHRPGEHLSDYSPRHLPDLPFVRRIGDADDHSACVTQPLGKQLLADQSLDLHAVTLAALCRILALYCGVSDVLLALDFDKESDTFYPIRVKWNDDTPWSTLVSDVHASISSRTLPRLSVFTARDTLGLDAKQWPFISSIHLHASQSDCAAPSPCPHFCINLPREYISFHYLPNHVHQSVASQLVSQVIATAVDRVQHPQSKFSSVPSLPRHLLSSVERLSPEECASHYKHIPPVRIVTDFILPHVTERPNATAVQWYETLDEGDEPAEELTYSELHYGSNKIARWLVSLGVRPGDRVAVSMYRDVRFHQMLFGVLKAGACYVPIDPELPYERKSFLASDSEARVVLTTDHFEIFSDSAVDTSSADVRHAIDLMSDSDLDIATPEGLAYMLYTSGTTGKPKGCLLTHEGFVQAIWALSSLSADVRMDDVRKGKYLGVASVAFDVHLSETMVSFSLGMTIACAPRSVLLEDLPSFISELKVTHVGIVPSLIDATMGTVEDTDDMALRFIASGGEKMSDTILDKWANHTVVRLANFYGPSEVTIGCAARVMDPAVPKSNIGPTFANVSSYVVDEDLNILPRGCVGELVVEGPLVGRGYHGRPDLASRVFLEWPSPGQRSYRTGDLVRMMPDGTLEIMGRKDTQVKLRGVRIEVDEISSVLRRAATTVVPSASDTETVLSSHPKIGGGSVPQLVSFVALDPSVPVQTRRNTRPKVVQPPKGLLATSREAFEKQLANYMRPSHVIPVDFLPLNPNGKTDAKVLATMFQELDFDTLIDLSREPSTASELTTVQPPSHPSTPTEEALVSIVKAHTGLTSLSVDSNFFACGLDSLSLVRVAADITREFGKRVSMSELMANPTISGIASYVDESGQPRIRVTDGSVLRQFRERWLEEIEDAYSRDKVEEILPAFPVQEGVLSSLDESPNMFVQHVVIKLLDASKAPQLRGALQAVMNDAQILRTVFHFGAELVQVVLRPSAVRLSWRERSVPDIEESAFSDWFFAKEAEHISEGVNNDISTQPPFVVHLYSAPTYTCIVLSIQHALFDGISLPLLLKRIDDEAAGRPSSKAGELRPALEEISRVNPADTQRYWSTYFKGFEWLSASEPLPFTESPKRKHISFKQSLSYFKEKMAKHEVTLQALLSSAFAYLLASRLFHKNDVAFGVIRSGRLLPVDKIDELLCPTICILPMRFDFNHSDNILRQAQQDISASVPYENVPLGKVQRWIGAGSGSLEALFSVSAKDETIYDSWEVLHSELPQPDFPLSVEIVMDQKADALTLEAAYYDSSLSCDIDSLLEDFEETVMHLLARGGSVVPTKDTGFVTFKATSNGRQLTVNTSSEKSLDTPPLTNGGSVSSSPPSTPVDRPQINSPDTLNGKAEGSIPVDDEIQRLQGIIANFFNTEMSFLTEETSFISLGLDSIRSVGLSRRLKKEGFQIPGGEIIRNPTISSIRAYLAKSASHRTKQRESEAAAAYRKRCAELSKSLEISSIKLKPDDKASVHPVTILQAGMLSQTVGSDGSLYVHAFPMRLSEEVDTERLKNSWQQATQSIDTLRTSFHFLADEGVWTQVVHSRWELNWREEEYDLEKSLLSMLSEQVSSVKFADENAFRVPPVFLRLLQSKDKSSRLLVLILHHALYDGTSIAMLSDEVQKIYRDSQLQRTPSLVDFLPRIMHEEQEGTPFWTERLQGYSVPRLASIAETAKSQNAVHHVELPSGSLDKLVRYAAVTPQTVAQAAWARFLSIAYGTEDVLFGHVVSGRSMEGSEDVIGPMLNTIPCRVKLEQQISNRDLVRQIHENNTLNMQWQHASLRAVQNKLQVARLWDSLFLFQPNNEETGSSLWEFVEAELSDLEYDAHVQYPMNVEFYQTDTGFVLKAVSLSSFMSAQNLGDALRLVGSLLQHIVQEPDHPHTTFEAPTRTFITAINPDSNVSSPSPQDESQTSDQPLPEFLDILSSMANVPVSRLNLDRSPVTLGIDSITAIRLRSTCRKAGLVLSIGDIVNSKTLLEMTKKVKKKPTTSLPTSASSTPSPSTPLTPGSLKAYDVSEKDIPSVSQRFPRSQARDIEFISAPTSGMKWFISAWQASQRTRFQAVFAWRLGDHVETERLRSAWNTLLKHHPILRSTFASPKSGGDPHIVTFKASDAVLRGQWHEDSVNSDYTEGMLTARMGDILANSLPLHLPQAKAFLYQTKTDRHLLIRLHHFQYDAWSMRMLYDDLVRIYHGSAPSSFADLPTFLQEYKATDDQADQQKEYWKRLFGSLKQPNYFPCLAGERTTSPRRTIINPVSTTSRTSTLVKQAQSLELSVQAILLACWAQVQSSLTLTHSATFGLWDAGRTVAIDDIENYALPCVNVLPLHVVTGKDGILTVAERVQNELRRRSATIQQTDLQDVHMWAGRSDSPLCNVFVNVIKIAKNSTTLAVEDDTLRHVRVPYGLPPEVTTPDERVLDKLRLTNLIRDDITVDIIIDEDSDRASISVDCADYIMNEEQATELVNQWSRAVEEWCEELPKPGFTCRII